MNPVPMSDSLVEEFLNRDGQVAMNSREQYLARETLYSLMRLAKSEQLLAIRQSVCRLVPASLQPHSVKRGKGKKMTSFFSPGQCKLVFGKQD